MSESLDAQATDPIEIRDSRPFWAFCGALMGSLATLSAVAWGWGPFGLVVFGTHTVRTFARLLSRRTRLRITDEGIVDENFWYSPGLIKWDEILDVSAARWGAIEIDLLDANAFLARLSGLAQLYRVKLWLKGFGPAVIIPWGLEGSRRELIEILETGMDSYALSVVRRGASLACGSPH